MHRIRLEGPWEVTWGETATNGRAFRALRRFQRPLTDLAGVRMFLEIADAVVPMEVWLNGNRIGEAILGAGATRVEIQDLRKGTNELTLVGCAQTPDAGTDEGAMGGLPWAKVTLLFDAAGTQ